MINDSSDTLNGTKQNIVDELFGLIMNKLATGEWVPGQRIPSENELKDTFGVSRNSVRQTLQRMQALGLLESRQGDGTFIKKADSSYCLNVMLPEIMFDAEDRLNLFEFHTGIQIACVKLACSRKTPEQIEALKERVDRMVVAGSEGNLREFNSVDLDFHRIIARMSSNSLFIKTTDLIYQRLFYYLESTVSRYGHKQSVQFHQNIVQAIERGDVMVAAALMESHLADISQKLSSI